MAKITPEKKERLKKLLRIISTPEERQELERLDAKKVREIVSLVDNMETENDNRLEMMRQNMGLVIDSIQKQRSSQRKYDENMSELFTELTSALSTKLEELGGKITTSYEKNKPVNAAGVYKDMINQLSAIKKSVDDKPVPVWNWPQYASVGVRNKSFSNVNPSVDYFNIGSYDYVSVAYPINTEEVYTFKTNGATGNTVATITIVYTDSTKDNISTVTKTPVNA